MDGWKIGKGWWIIVVAVKATLKYRSETASVTMPSSGAKQNERARKHPFRRTGFVAVIQQILRGEKYIITIITDHLHQKTKP